MAFPSPWILGLLIAVAAGRDRQVLRLAFRNRQLGKIKLAGESNFTRNQSVWQASFHPLEFLDLKVMLLEQLVEVSAIFACKFCGLTNIAFGHGKHLNQVFSFKRISRIFKGPQPILRSVSFLKV